MSSLFWRCDQGSIIRDGLVTLLRVCHGGNYAYLLRHIAVDAAAVLLSVSVLIFSFISVAVLIFSFTPVAMLIMIVSVFIVINMILVLVMVTVFMMRGMLRSEERR